MKSILKTKTAKIILGLLIVFVLVGIFSGGENSNSPTPSFENTSKNEQVGAAQEAHFAGTKQDDTTSPTHEDFESEQEETSENSFYSVVKVVDGDTLSIRKDGQEVTLRLIGIDTPETVHPSKPVECFGREASHKAKEILSGSEVRIETDTSQGAYDKYDRLLAYVFLKDGTHFNKMMIEEGYAYEYTYNLPYKYQSAFKQAEQEAKISNRGLWAPGACEEKQEETKQNSPQQTSGGSNLQNVPTKNQCSENIYNCSDFSTHNEAQATYEYCGGVANDIHRLDRDKDGKACETLP